MINTAASIKITFKIIYLAKSKHCVSKGLIQNFVQVVHETNKFENFALDYFVYSQGCYTYQKHRLMP